jgi:hypothetical protein
VHRFSTTAACSCLLAALSACEPPAGSDSEAVGIPSGLEVPIVFASRQGRASILPVEADGRDERPGGVLYRLEPDGTLYELVVGPPLFDVARPAVSPDGETIIFAAVQTEDDSWSLWTVPAAGGGATRITHPTHNPVQDTIESGGDEFAALAGVGVYSPFWLADGRIGFASTRYPSLAASCGRRSTNIYVMSIGDYDPMRITTTRSGIIDPWPLADGRIVGSYYKDNMNAPHPEAEGLRPLEAQRHWQTRSWHLWAFDPDGTGACRYANVTGGIGGDDIWGVHQPKELPDGRIVATIRNDATLIDLDSYRSAVTIFEPGWVDPHEVEGLGLPLDTSEGYALSPSPLPDGRVLISWGRQRISEDGQELRPDFDLWVVDADLDPDSMALVWHGNGTDELDAVPIMPWEADQHEGGVDWIPSEDPREDDGKSAYLTCENVYADLPLSTGQPLSPSPGSVWSVQFWDDTQQFDTDDNPRLNKQMPEFLGEVPVAADGSWAAEVPADRPFFYMLVGPSGVAARMRYSPTVEGEPAEGQDFFVPVHDFMRPGTFGTCRGCHPGHMLDPGLALDEAETNLARLARVIPLGDLAEHEDFERGPQRLVDQRLPDAEDRFGWVDEGEATQMGAAISWDATMDLRSLRLYPLTAGGEVSSIRVLMGTTALSLSTPFDDEEPFVEMNLMGTRADRLEIWIEGAPPLGLGEISVQGQLPGALPSTALEAPTDLTLDDTFTLDWQDSDDPMLAGFHLLVTADGATEERDIGLVSSHRVLLHGAVPGQELRLQLRPYDLTGTASEDATSEALHAEVPTLRIDSVSPQQVTLGEPTEIRIEGAGFRPTEDFMLSTCGFELGNLEHAGGEVLVAWTRRDRPTEPERCDVTVSFDNGLEASLEGGLEFVEGE